MSHKKPITAAAAPPQDHLIKMYEDLVARTNNLSLELEERGTGSADKASEAWADLDWANRVDRDYLWMRVSGANSDQFRYMTKDTIDMYADITNFMYVFNPLINRAANVKTQFTFAMGYSVTPTDAENGIGDQIKAIQADPINRTAFFTHKAMIEMDLELLKSGNVFIAIWKDKDPVGLRAWSNSEIADIVTDPEDAARPLFYIRQWRDDAGKERRVAYPSMFALPEEIPADKTRLKFRGTEYDIDRSVVVYHISARKPLKAKFALNEFVAACRWAKPHEKFIEDFHAIASAYRKYSHMMTTKGTAGQSAKIATQFKGDTNNMGTPLQSNPVGSMVVATEGNELKTISAGSVNIIGIEGARASLMQVCAATGVPETYLTMDPSTGNLATAKEISPVFITMIEERQTGWKDALTDIFTFALESNGFEVSFAPIRDNIQQYVMNVNAFAWSNGQWTGAMKGKDYIKAGYETLEWKLPPEEEIEEMGAALDEGAAPAPADDPYSTDTGLTNVATAARELTQAVKEAAKLKEAEDDTEWITVGGQHIPIKPGQSKGDAVNQALGKGSGASSGGGSSDAGGSSSKGVVSTNDHKDYDKKLVKALAMGSNKELGGKIAAEQEKGMSDHFAYGKQFENDSTVNDYTRTGYAKLNNDLRSGKTDSPSVAKLDKIVSGSPALPEGTVLYRGIGERGVSSMMNMKPGDTCNDKAFQSFSTNPNNSIQFTTRATIEGEKGAHKVLLRAVTSGKEKGFVVGGGEHEIILPRGSGWKVVSNNAVTSGVNAGKVTTHVITVVPV